MSDHLKSWISLSFMGLFLVDCASNVAGRILYQPYHDPFDTSAVVGSSEIANSQAKELQAILDRSTKRQRSNDAKSFSADFLPFGTITLEGMESRRESCICYYRRIDCEKTHLYDIGTNDVTSYQDLMRRIDSTERSLRGATESLKPLPTPPVVPVE